ncbi:MAG: tetratricopeptide repeat protein [Saprospiraceae bacterium]
MKKHLAFVLCLSLTTVALSAPKTYTPSPGVKDAYQKAVRLRLGEARSAIEALKKSEPDNLFPIFIANYVDFLTAFLSDAPSDYNRLSKGMSPRLSQLAKGDPRSPWHLYAQAEIRFQWALLRGRFNNYMSSLSEIKQASALLEENARRHPDFAPNKKSLALIHALAGSTPEEYRWMLKAAGGLSGSVQQGMREMAELIAFAEQNEYLFEDEARFLYAYMQLYIDNKPDAAWSTLRKKSPNPATEPLAAYLTASMAMRIGKNDEAIALLSALPQSPPYTPIPYRDFLLGQAKLARLDADADKPLLRFVNRFKGETGVKEAYQKLAWHALIHNDRQGYHKYMSLVKTKGAQQSDTDKQALREAESGLTPDPDLLRARLLFDGGYYNKAFALLRDKSATYAAADERFRLEYDYRMGRIAHKLERFAEAEKHYKQTIRNGQKSPAHYACNAALQLGEMYEQQQQPALAREAYRQCLSISPEDYAAALHARAKAGLARVGVK